MPVSALAPTRPPARCRAGPRRGGPARTRSPAPATPARRHAAPPRTHLRRPDVERLAARPRTATARRAAHRRRRARRAGARRAATLASCRPSSMPAGTCAQFSSVTRSGAVIAMKARPAVGRRVQPHPGPPAGGADVAHRLGGGLVLVAPLVSAQPRQLVGDDGALQPAGGSRFGERHIAAPRAVHPGDRADRVDAIGRRLDDLDRVGVPERSVVGRPPATLTVSPGSA